MKTPTKYYLEVSRDGQVWYPASRIHAYLGHDWGTDKVTAQNVLDFAKRQDVRFLDGTLKIRLREDGPEVPMPVPAFTPPGKEAKREGRKARRP